MSDPGFLTALQELNRQFDIPMEELVRTLEEGLAAAYKTAFEVEGEVVVRVDAESGAISGEVDGEPVDADELRRLPPQATRALVLRRLRELERDKVLSEAARRQGELAVGTVDRIEGGVVHIDLGPAEGVMATEDQIPGEVLVPGRPVTVVVLEGRRAGAGAVFKVSRAAKAFVERLLEQEVPEIRSGAVQIKGIAREAGLRTKVAVATAEAGLDPVGACIGPRGVRHRAILAELPGEHVDVVEWFEDPGQFVARALGPATVTRVEVDHAAGTARIRVPAAQLSLAIGRDGQNARLAAKLTGWRIDIRPDEEE